MIHKQFRERLLSILILVFCASLTFAQPVLPQRTITVYPTQGIDFGKFCVTGTGGTITVGYDGVRTSTGGILLINSSSAHAAIFDVKLCEGRRVSLIYNPSTTLSGPSGPNLNLSLIIDNIVTSGQFFTNSDCNFVTPLRVGGTLEIPAGANTGTFAGTFSITFNQE